MLSSFFLLFNLLFFFININASTLPIDDIALLKQSIKKQILLKYDSLKQPSINISVLNKDRLNKYKEKKYDYKLKTTNKLLGRCILPISLEKNGKEHARVNLLAQIDVYSKVAKTKDKISKGEFLSSKNIEFSMQNITGIYSDIINSFEYLKNKQAKFLIPKNVILKKSLIKEVPIIKNGDKVLIRFISGRIVVEAEGIARGDGYKQQKIKVQNIKSKKYLEAEVFDRYTVIAY